MVDRRKKSALICKICGFSKKLWNAVIIKRLTCHVVLDVTPNNNVQFADVINTSTSCNQSRSSSGASVCCYLKILGQL